jgi:hypothetical protein
MMQICFHSKGVVFDNKVFVKFKIRNNLEQIIDETDSKQQISREKKIREPKVWRLLSNLCDVRQGYGFKSI